MEDIKHSEITHKRDSETNSQGFYDQLLEKRIRPHFRPGETLHIDEALVKEVIIQDKMIEMKSEKEILKDYSFEEVFANSDRKSVV